MKLLTRTIKNYIIFTGLLLVLCTPLFYVGIRSLFEHEMDEVLRAHKEDFLSSLPSLRSGEDFRIYHLMNKEFILTQSNSLLTTDRIYSTRAYDERKKEMIPFRVLETGVIIKENPYLLTIRESTVDSTELIKAIMSIQAIVFTFLFAGLVLINRKLSKIIWDPFYQILGKLKKFRIDHAEVDLPHSSTREFRDLSLVISQLMMNSHLAYTRQKEFTENASHELQTPLAICKSKLELLMQSPELTKEQAAIIESMADAMDRITRMNRNLLLLSRIEGNQFSETEDIYLNNVIEKFLLQYTSQGLEKEIKINTQLHPVTIKGNHVLFEILVSNLLNNAIRHTSAGGEISITLDNKQLIISNTGKPLEKPDRIFERFQRESKTNHGSGLGLAIVKQIVESEKLKIGYSYQHGSHHFVVSLPEEE